MSTFPQGLGYSLRAGNFSGNFKNGRLRNQARAKWPSELPNKHRAVRGPDHKFPKTPNRETFLQIRERHGLNREPKMVC